MIETKLKVEGMHCEGCENRIKKVLSEMPEIEKVIANHKTGDVAINSEKEINMEIIKEKIEDLGFIVND